MMRVIKVYGSLAKFLGQRSFRAAVSTPAEAMRFLVANFPGLREHMAEKYYKVGVGKIDLDIGDQPEQLHYPTGKAEAIRIVPVITGAKSGATSKILIGIGLIAAAFIIGPAVGGFLGIGAGLGGAVGSGAGLVGGAFASSIGMIGVSLVIGGVAQLLTPVPKTSFDQSDPSKSYNFSGIQNVSRQGVPVPICYGEVLVGSVVISAGINAEDI
jgi:predicted phage tail protein